MTSSKDELARDDLVAKVFDNKQHVGYKPGGRRGC